MSASSRDRPSPTGPDEGELPSPTHLDEEGRARMVDVSEKAPSRRTAVAEGEIRMRTATLEAIRRGEVSKGEVLTVARLAAIAGAKRTPELIPLCHPLPLDRVETEIRPDPELPGLRLRVTASAEARTGVEMEAMMAVSAGLLAIYDMCKAVDRGMTVGPIRLLEKRGGSSGHWLSPREAPIRVDRKPE